MRDKKALNQNIFEFNLGPFAFFSPFFLSGGQQREIIVSKSDTKVLITDYNPSKDYTVSVIAVSGSEQSRPLQGRHKGAFMQLTFFVVACVPFCCCRVMCNSHTLCFCPRVLRSSTLFTCTLLWSSLLYSAPLIYLTLRNSTFKSFYLLLVSSALLSLSFPVPSSYLCFDILERSCLSCFLP